MAEEDDLGDPLQAYLGMSGTALPLSMNSRFDQENRCLDGPEKAT